MYKSYYISNVYRLKKQTERRIKAVMVIIYLQDFQYGKEIVKTTKTYKAKASKSACVKASVVG